MKKDLITDYLNEKSNITGEKVIVKNCTDNGSYITVSVEWEYEGFNNHAFLDIPLFDLMNFIYSRN